MDGELIGLLMELVPEISEQLRKLAKRGKVSEQEVSVVLLGQLIRTNKDMFKEIKDAFASADNRTDQIVTQAVGWIGDIKRALNEIQTKLDLLATKGG